MIYRVLVNHQKYEIEDAQTALSFAELAKATCKRNNGDRVTVSIDLLEDEEVAKDE